MPLPHSSPTLPSTSITISKPRVQSESSLSRMEARHQEGGREERTRPQRRRKARAPARFYPRMRERRRDGSRQIETVENIVRTTDQEYNRVQYRRLPSLIHIPQAGDESGGEMQER